MFKVNEKMSSCNNFFWEGEGEVPSKQASRVKDNCGSLTEDWLLFCIL
jgi:hypothetical protein